MTTLPAFLAPPPEQEALELGLEHIIFDPLEQDAKALEEARDEETPPLKAYALLDASQSSDIPVCLEGFNDPACCLFDGEAGDELGEVAPWLVEITRYSDAWDWFVEDGYGNNWGIIVHSRLGLFRLKTQLKKFLEIEDEDGEIYFFKYYRPEHLNAYLPIFDEQQRLSFMKGVEAIYAEYRADTNMLVRHMLKDDKSLSSGQANIFETGDPYRIQPASPDEAEQWIKAAQENA